MAMTGKQAHVLANLERVTHFPRKLGSPPRQRYQLDGWERTQQIPALIVQSAVDRSAARRLQRVEA